MIQIVAIMGVIFLRKQLKDRRTELGLSQQDVAERAGMTRANYAHIERGRHEPNLEQIAAIAKALDVNPDINFFKNHCDETYHKGVCLVPTGTEA